MACTSLVKLNASSSQWISWQSFNQRPGSSCRFASPRVSIVRAESYSDELVKTATKTSKRKKDEYHVKEESPHANTSNNVDMRRIDPPFVSFRSLTIPPLSKRCRLLEPYSNEEETTL
ncbi:uncharacterized protein LOC114261201 isoform X2 [Camellia sinensis]|uniref:uncharacterized protein LOC114261201 isoform X1 n=1 Tax=Camellia sinensis TaxID=4442 RepID=UPI00103620AF|nr:uncharacterized protein LOC114261201 isoform X1 [Camellia sinensis]XP_028057226.1 uncharacterized protein LOC114261201 isoform X2 [Camellia sinensis]